MSGSTLITMTDVDALSINEWPSLLEHLNITKAVKGIESLDLLGKGLDYIKKMGGILQYLFEIDRF